MESKYAEKFKRLSQEGKDLYRFIGPTILVEVLPKQELKTKGGLIMGVSDSHKATAQDFRRQLGLVILVGEGYADAEMDVNVGNVVLLPANPIFLSEFPGLVDYTQNTLALVDEKSILFCYKDLDAYKKASEILNG